MNFLFPDRRARCLAENATHHMHNILTLRGAVVRAARLWSRYLDEAIEMFTDDIDVAFASHHRPIRGRDEVVEFLSQQRDPYAYLRDQTLRMLNEGLTGKKSGEVTAQARGHLDRGPHRRPARLGRGPRHRPAADRRGPPPPAHPPQRRSHPAQRPGRLTGPYPRAADADAHQAAAARRPRGQGPGRRRPGGRPAGTDRAGCSAW